MTLLVDMTSKDVINYIKSVSNYPKTNPLSPYITIPIDQFDLYAWAKAYEEGLPEVSDHIYDMYVRYLQRQQIMYPDIWDEVSLECFKDGSWQFTGMFINDHNTDDEEWLL